MIEREREREREREIWGRGKREKDSVKKEEPGKRKISDTYLQKKADLETDVKIKKKTLMKKKWR